jgi:hypothetical protein
VGVVGDVEQRGRDMPKRKPVLSQPMVASAATALLLALLSTAILASLPRNCGAAEPGDVASPAEVRARRLFREEDPIWRRMLALPADFLELTFWPLRETLFWMERIDLPGRLKQVVVHPTERASGPEPSA